MNQFSIGYLSGRVLIGILFALAGMRKIVGYNEVAYNMSEAGVPDILLPVVILIELGGALALFSGWQVHRAASGLALFCVVAAFLFHFNFEDPVERVMFLKDLAIAGGLLILATTQFVPLQEKLQ